MIPVATAILVAILISGYVTSIGRLHGEREDRVLPTKPQREQKTRLVAPTNMVLLPLPLQLSLPFCPPSLLSYSANVPQVVLYSTQPLSPEASACA